MIAQAEHDESATAILVTTSHALALGVQKEILLQLEIAPRKAIARRALDGQGMIVIVRTMRDAIGIVNAIAPEHAELMVRHPREIQSRILNAGSVFLGAWATETLGDYAAGVNHTLPTSGSARFSSPLSVADFMKFMNVVDASREGFRRLAPAVEILAASEGLAGHAASVRIRRELKR
jgi:histidinol dehydrogenase